jgi:inner membrane protein
MSKIDIKNSIGTRLIIIAVLTLLLLIPALMIQSLISERKDRRNTAANEISENWGGKQFIIGPILSVPFKLYIKDEKNNIVQTIQYAHFLPEDLQIEGLLNPEIRYRGIYEVVVYNSKLSISGEFNPLDLNELNISSQDILWKDAIMSLGISDMKGIKDFIQIDWNNTQYLANPGIETNDVISTGICIKPKISETKEKYQFKIELNLNGSFGLLFSPVGKETKVELTSNWSNPSFTGNFLPINREISADGFKSNWKILHLNRNFPQKWIGSQYQVSEATFGVNLLLSVDEYQKTMRTAKYAIMFISLTFLTFFMIELLSKKVIHPIQFLLIGFALLIFYTLLLSISEYLVFKFSYIIACAGIILLISLYTKTVLNDLKQTAIVTGVLIILYGYLYIILQLQDYALLMGSIGLFFVLSIVMYLTRKIDWFTIMKSQELDKK